MAWLSALARMLLPAPGRPSTTMKRLLSKTALSFRAERAQLAHFAAPGGQGRQELSGRFFKHGVPGVRRDFREGPQGKLAKGQAFVGQCQHGRLQDGLAPKQQ